jgi:uncharacterized protein (DUF1778 family)
MKTKIQAMSIRPSDDVRRRIHKAAALNETSISEWCSSILDTASKVTELTALYRDVKSVGLPTAEILDKLEREKNNMLAKLRVNK